MLKYKLLESDGDSFLTVYIPGQGPLLASNESHSNFDQLVEAVRADDPSVAELFDTGRAIQKQFADVVEGRVAVRDGVVYFDDDAVDNSITEAILNFHGEGAKFGPLVKFMENVYANPQVESRDQLYRWLQHHQFPIDDDGFIVAYKGVKSDGNGGYTSIHSGSAFVNGVLHNGQIPNAVGDVVTMPRSEVDFDPNSSCSTGLHLGTYNYASGYSGNGALMHVRFNPRDAVSVPHDSSSQKIRVCRYEVVAFAESEHTGAHWASEQYDDYDEPASAGPFVDNRPTRWNYKKQARDAFGKFIPKS